jgi:phosphate:Na+ symporter
MGSDSVARQVANGHTIFTVFAGLLFLPFTAQIAWLTRKVIPDTTKVPPFGPKYLNDQVMSVPVLALEQAQREILRMTDIGGDMLRKSMVLLENPSEEGAQELKAEDDKLDILEQAIRPFLAKVAQTGLTPELSARERSYIYFVQELEGMGDVLSKEIAGAAIKLTSGNNAFSEQGLSELKEYHDKLMKKYKQTVTCMTELDRRLAEQIVQLGFKERLFERKLRESHLGRLHSQEEVTVATSALHLSVLSNFRTVSGRLEAIARTVMMEL